MKRKIFLILTFLLMLCESVISQQTTKEIYEFVINITYKKLIKQKYITELDSLFITCWFNKEETVCFGEKLNITNKKNVLGTPKSNGCHLINISPPAIRGKYIVITVGHYNSGWDEDLNSFVLSTTFGEGTEYYFRYSEKKKKWILIKSEEYGI